uniref:Uncharacterized 3.1 kDa protein in psbJ-trnE intergenic region n=1 Tax=Trieres chinensis TaxID=1514140 RepID=YCX8_TRICV|nr:ORF25 [Trieres chinensis]P49834.1 RecName: Full=Uncharacterized 3.1 kDa protein in psbJ-trnE intergenic region; AltName: Full=ORF25 [Trieres chinensis]CAA91716.1 ORF25 [Trieres chinensis]
MFEISFYIALKNFNSLGILKMWRFI